MSVKQNGVPLGGALVAVTLPAFAIHAGWRSALLVAGLVALGSAILSLYYDSVRPKDVEVHVSMAISPERFRKFREIVRNRDLMLLSVLVIPFQALQLSLITYFTIFLKAATGRSLVFAGALFSLCNMSGIIGRLFWGYTSDYFLGGDRKGVLIAMAGLSSLLCLGFAFLSQDMPLWFVVLLVAVFGFTAMGWPGIFLTMVAELSGGAQAGSAFGVCVAVVSLGVFIGPPLFGYIVDTTHSYANAWFAFAGLMVLSASLLRFVRQGTREGREANVGPEALPPDRRGSQ
jgi:predicted MFS family arabinose efflux permease